MGIKLLRGFAYLWFCLIGGLLFVSFVSIWYTEGFSKVQEIFSPFNLVNFIVTLVSLSPGIGAYLLAEKLAERSARLRAAPPQADGSGDWEGIEALVQSYGATLEVAAATKSIVVDQDRLPAPKDEIKLALLVALRVTRDPQMLEQLKIGYLELSIFQPRVGNAPVSFNLPPIPDPNDREGILATARSMAESGPEVERWLSIVSQEREQLVAELKRAGFWQPAA